MTPIVCIVEWWRGRTDRRDKLLRSVIVEPLPLSAAKAAGMALAKLKQRVDSKLSIDAAVVKPCDAVAGCVTPCDVSA